MKKSLALFATVLAAVLNAATPSTSLVYKNTTTNALTGNIVVGNNTTISATGNGTITATALTGNISGNPTVSGNLTVSGGTARFQDPTNSYGVTITTAATKTLVETLFGGSSLGIRVGGSGSDSLTLASTGATIRDNLTVSGTGNSSVAGNLGIGESSPVVPLHVKTTGTGTGDFDNAVATFRSTASGRAVTLQFSDTANQSYISSKSGALIFGTGGAVNRMSLSSTGILALYTTTPPAWDPASFSVMVAGSNAFGGTNTGSNNLIVASNTYFDGSVFKYATTGTATAYRQLVGEHYFYVAASGTAGNTTSLTTALTIKSGGTLQLNQYGAGTLTTDSSGNVTATSDERAKNITGTFTKGLAEVVKLTPKRYTWKPETGLNTTDEVASLTAQDLIAAGIPEAVSTYRTVADLNDDGTPKLDADGKPLTKRIDATYTVSDRAVIAALVNAVKELKAEVDALKAARN